MPLYEYLCLDGHLTEKLRARSQRTDAVVCDCGLPALYVPSAHHTIPDGVYSYAPNIGTANEYERKQQLIKDRKEKR